MIAGLPPALSGADRAGMSSGVAAAGIDPAAAAAAPFSDMFVALLGTDMNAAPGTTPGAVAGSVPGMLSRAERAVRGQAQDGTTMADASPASPASPDDHDEDQTGAAISAALTAFLTSGALPVPIARREATAAGDATEGDRHDSARRLAGWASAQRVDGPVEATAPVASTLTPRIDVTFGARVAAAQGQAPAAPPVTERTPPDAAPVVDLALSMATAAPTGAVDPPTPREAQSALREAQSTLREAQSAPPEAQSTPPEARSTTPATPRAGTGGASQDTAYTATPAPERVGGATGDGHVQASRPEQAGAAAAVPPGAPLDGPRASAPTSSPSRGERRAMDADTPAPAPTGQVAAAASVVETNAGQQPGAHSGESHRRARSEPAVGQIRRPVPTGMPQGGDAVVEPARPAPQAQEFHAADVAMRAGSAAPSSVAGAPPIERAPILADRSAAAMGVVAAPVSGAPMAIEVEHPHLAEAPVRGRALDDVLPTQIVQSLRMQWAAGTSEATVQLRPEYLGALTVSIKVEQGAVVTTLQAESAEVRRWIEANTATLRDALAEHGLRLERVVVREPADPAEDRGSDRREGERPPQRRAPSDQRRRRPGERAPTFDLES